jgi:hypothetical protein
VPNYAIEDDADGRHLVVTGPWDPLTRDRLHRGDIRWLVLDCARGYEGKGLWFLDPWPIWGLRLVDRSVTDLAPLRCLGPVLAGLEIRVSPQARLDLAEFHQLEYLSATWEAIRDTLPQLAETLRTLDVRGPEIDSLAPLAGLRALESFSAGEAVIDDGDLSPLLELPHLREVRIPERDEYAPSLAEVRARIDGGE